MKIISIIIKDLKTILSDKKALAIILLMPIILMTILSFALKGSFASGDDLVMEKVSIAVVKKYDLNLDNKKFEKTLNNGFLSGNMGDTAVQDIIDSSEDVNPEKLFFEEFLQSEEVSKIISYKIEDENTALELLNKGTISAIVVLPENYIYNMKINLLTPFRNQLDINILTHPDKNIDGKIVKAVVDAYTNSMSSIIIGKNVLIESVMANNLGDSHLNNMADMMEGMSKVIENINIDMDNVTVEGRKQVTSADYYAVAMTTMFILYAANHGGRMLLEEKENITLQRMLIAGTSRFGILTGKFITIFLIAIIQILAMISYSHFALSVDWGSIPMIIAISLAASFAVASLGSFVAAATLRSGNYKMANIFETAIVQGMALLGGSFFPLDVMPKALQKFSFLSLNGIALKAYLKTIVGYGFGEIFNYVVSLTVLGVLFLILAVLILKEKGVGSDVQHNKIKTVKA